MFSSLATKHRVCVKGASKQTSEFYSAGTVPPGFDIPGSATVDEVQLIKIKYKKISG